MTGDEHTDSLQTQLLQLEQRVRELVAQKDGAYLERNRCVALIARTALASGWRAGIARTAIEGWSEDWQGCVYVDLPTGQVSWHYHDSQAELFADLPAYGEAWDGHDTTEKYRRVSTAFAGGRPVTFDDPMDWPLPCDVTVGHGTICRGVKLRTLVTRMKVLYEMATGANADEVAAESIETRQARYEGLMRQLRGDAPRNSGELLDMVLEELERATRKFPTWPTDPLHALAVLGEEYGELTKAVLQVTYEPLKASQADVRTEAIQTAAMAIRWANSLAVYAYRPSEQHEQEVL